MNGMDTSELNDQSNELAEVLAKYQQLAEEINEAKDQVGQPHTPPPTLSLDLVLIPYTFTYIIVLSLIIVLTVIV